MSPLIRERPEFMVVTIVVCTATAAEGFVIRRDQVLMHPWYASYWIPLIRIFGNQYCYNYG
jgi:hypothetical protein